MNWGKKNLLFIWIGVVLLNILPFIWIVFVSSLSEEITSCRFCSSYKPIEFLGVGTLGWFFIAVVSTVVSFQVSKIIFKHTLKIQNENRRNHSTHQQARPTKQVFESL